MTVELRCENCGGYHYSTELKAGMKPCKCKSKEFVRKEDFINPELLWGTYGKNGDQPLREVMIKDCDIEHLQNILKTQHRISQRYKETIEHVLLEKELSYIRDIKRDELPLHVNDEIYMEEAQAFYRKRVTLGV